MLNKKIRNSILIFLLIISPWFNANYFDDLKQPEESNKLSFYEINPCKISLFEYVSSLENINDVNLNGDSYSPIYCFGRISQIKNNQQVSVGTNFIINFLLLALIVYLIVSIIQKDKYKQNISNLNILLLTSLIITGLIFSDRKYYESKLFLLKIDKFSTYLFLIIFIALLYLLLLDIFLSNKKILINYLPYLFLIDGIIYQSNLNIFAFFFLYLGIESVISSKFKNIFYYIYSTVTFMWVLNARTPYVKYPQEYLGFTSTSYDLYSVFFYSIFILFTFIGVISFLNESLCKLKFSKLLNSFYIVVIFKFLIYFIYSKSSTIYFVIQNYFGINKYENTIFSLDGFFKSNQQLLVLIVILYFISKFNLRKFTPTDLFGIVLTLFFISSSQIYLNSLINKFNMTLDFFNIYNPTFLEMIIGSGPLNYNQIYMESGVETIPDYHSFVSSFLLFFGLLGILSISLFVLLKLISKKYLFVEKVLMFLLTIIFSLNDSINELSFFIIYIFLFKFIFDKYATKTSVYL
tara:strand:+ start:950 stop:2512 length:1563 start_codon:yes stop_codon:yes gene_type:complete